MTEKSNRTPKGVSRREFLRDAGLIVGGTAIGSTVLLAACGGEEKTVTETITETVTNNNTVTNTATTNTTKTVEVPASSFDTINLTINGQSYQNISVKPYWTLKDLLHDELGFIEIKEMCTGLGACGSCTVIMDNRPVLSCMTLAATCDGAVIETSTGIAESNHPLVETYIKHHCMQCGYCTPGFVTTAKALLDKNPHPTEQEIKTALGGNLCRCSTYPAHIDAILEAAELLEGGE